MVQATRRIAFVPQGKNKQRHTRPTVRCLLTGVRGSRARVGTPGSAVGVSLAVGSATRHDVDDVDRMDETKGVLRE
jgi:hypothetical protein